MAVMVHVGRSEDNLQQPVLSLHHVGPADRNPIVRLEFKPFCAMLFPQPSSFDFSYSNTL